MISARPAGPGGLVQFFAMGPPANKPGCVVEGVGLQRFASLLARARADQGETIGKSGGNALESRDRAGLSSLPGSSLSPYSSHQFAICVGFCRRREA